MGENKQSRRTKIFLGERHTSIFNRLIAKSIDMLIVVAIYLLLANLWNALAWILALLCCAFMDGLGTGQSIGKRILGLCVVEDQFGAPATLKQSALRNIAFFIAIPFAGSLIFWFVFLLVTVPLVFLELYLILSLDSGVRLGDVLANTLVVEHLEDGLVAFQ